MTIGFKIKNWGKYNDRPNRVNYSWLRFENNFFEDERVYSLNSDEKVLYIYLLCIASKCNNVNAVFNIEKCSKILGVSESWIESSIEEFHDNDLLEDCGIMRVDAAEIRQMQPDAGKIRPTYERTNVRTIAQAQSVYEKYPRKIGRKRGIASLAKKFEKEEINCDDACRAVANYAAFCASNGTEERYIKHFSSFVSVIEDWISLEVAHERRII